MDKSRRRFIAAAGVALIAGCNEQSQPEPERTVTPVDVPESPGDVLEAVEDVPVPSIPPATIVSEDHRRSVIQHVSERIRTTEAALAAADDVDLDDVGSLRVADDPMEAARAQLQRYRTSPSPRQFGSVVRAYRDVATVLGHVWAATGNLDAEKIRTAFNNVNDRYDELTDDVDYRLASPVVQYLPTVAAAEATFDRAENHRYAGHRDFSAIAEASPGVVSEVWRSIELLRLERVNATGYVATALDPSAPPRGRAIARTVGTQLEALTMLEVPRRADGRPLPSRIRTVLSSVRARRSNVLASADPTDPETAQRVERLIETVRIKGQLEAFEVAADETFPRIDDEDGFPAERLPEAKRRAVDRLDALAGAAPLQRHLGRLAEDMVSYGDRLGPGQGTDPVASAHFIYVAAREFADLSMRRGEELADVLEVDATSTP